MNIRLSLLNVFMPAGLKKRKLIELLDITAKGFQISPPPLDKMSFDETLELYATFTKEAAQRYMDGRQEVKQVKHRLYNGAYVLGNKIRGELGIHSRREAMKAARILYRALGIDFHCYESSEVVIRRCYFSDFYSYQVCWIISSLDEGLIAGLTRGGKLWFVSRITEGNRSCLGAIEFERRDTT